MRRARAVENIRKVVDAVGRWVSVMDGLPISSLWAYGELLEAGESSFEVARVAFVVDLPAEEVTWMCLPLEAVGFAGAAGLEKLPVARVWRPAVWPVWNHAIRRPVRVWDQSGPDDAALEALRSGEGIEGHRLAEPDADVFREQLAIELEASLARLRQVTDSYWEREWRRAHTGLGIHPDDHLWRAAAGYLELRDAVVDPD